MICEHCEGKTRILYECSRCKIKFCEHCKPHQISANEDLCFKCNNEYNKIIKKITAEFKDMKL